jgi:hypothetical protein
MPTATSTTCDDVDGRPRTTATSTETTPTTGYVD